MPALRPKRALHFAGEPAVPPWVGNVQVVGDSARAWTPNMWPQSSLGAILDPMSEDPKDRPAPDSRTDDDATPDGDAVHEPENPGGLDERPDYTGLPKSVFGRAMLALLAVFWIVAVITLFTQGGK
jgi:hypothetical protein